MIMNNDNNNNNIGKIIIQIETHFLLAFFLTCQESFLYDKRQGKRMV